LWMQRYPRRMDLSMDTLVWVMRGLDCYDKHTFEV
jgi:hypothetical protein